MPDVSKDELRREVLRKWDAMGERDAASPSIVEKVTSLSVYKGAGAVMAYAGIGSEVGTGPSCAPSCETARRSCFPR